MAEPAGRRSSREFSRWCSCLGFGRRIGEEGAGAGQASSVTRRGGQKIGLQVGWEGRSPESVGPMIMTLGPLVKPPAPPAPEGAAAPEPVLAAKAARRRACRWQIGSGGRRRRNEELQKKALRGLQLRCTSLNRMTRNIMIRDCPTARIPDVLPSLG